MRRDNQDIEDRIFALLGEMNTPLEIVDILGLDRSGEALVWKVIEERDTPNGIAIREGIERLAAIRI